MIQLANKNLEYADCSRRDSTLEVKKKVRREIKEIEGQIDSLKDELVILTAATPTNGHGA